MLSANGDPKLFGNGSRTSSSLCASRSFAAIVSLMVGVIMMLCKQSGARGVAASVVEVSRNHT